MKRREFLKFLGIVAVTAPVVAALPETPQTHTNNTLYCDCGCNADKTSLSLEEQIAERDKWEDEMADSLVALVKKRQSELVKQMWENELSGRHFLYGIKTKGVV